MKKLSIALALAGLLLGTVLIGWFGFDRVIAGLRRVGWADFALIVGWQLVLFVVLGLAWDAITPPREARRPWVFVWGRMVRDASANCLPFSQVGGFIFDVHSGELLAISSLREPTSHSQRQSCTELGAACRRLESEL